MLLVVQMNGNDLRQTKSPSTHHSAAVALMLPGLRHILLLPDPVLHKQVLDTWSSSSKKRHENTGLHANKPSHVKVIPVLAVFAPLLTATATLGIKHVLAMAIVSPVALGCQLMAF